MAEVRTGAVTFKSNPVDLVGPELTVGSPAPDFTLQGSDLSDVTLANTAGKTRIIATIPSLDTPVCADETRKFNEAAGDLENTDVLVVSMDLPFGQSRWCGAAGVNRVETLSDYKDRSFGPTYGLYIKELG